MLNHNGYAAYANSKIMTASPAGLRKTISRKHITTSGKSRISSPSFRQH